MLKTEQGESTFAFLEEKQNIHRELQTIIKVTTFSRFLSKEQRTHYNSTRSAGTNLSS